MCAMKRRSFLNGLLRGGGVMVALPMLDLFLNSNGSAYASGAPLPVRFGTWFWGCGVIPDRWAPTQTGADFALSPQLMPLETLRQKITVLSDFSVPLDGRSNNPHISGNIGLRTGVPVDNWMRIEGPTIDVAIASAIGSDSLHRSLQLSADGNPETSYSYLNGNAMNAAIPTVSELYTKVFGVDFRDPNAAEFEPDVKILARRSVLSSVSEQRRKLLGQLGAEDRARIDQYFSSIRDLENKLALQLERPPPAEACSVPTIPKPATVSTDVDERKQTHRIMAELLAMALACNQTKVFNMTFAQAFSDLRRTGESTGYHQMTHEEFVDFEKGYQPTVDSYVYQNMEAWAEFVEVMDSVPEGDGTLLDRMLILAHSDVSYGKNHSVRGMPMMLAGSGGGRFRTGLHIAGNGAPVSEVGLTLQQAFGVPIDSWGTQSMRASRGVPEILVS